MSSPRSWDIFCHVADNFGDVGVCWRLARQLAGRYAAAVRFWIDDLGTLHKLAPDTQVDRERQRVESVEVCRWAASFPVVHPADVVIEAFGCGLPPPYVAAMAERGRSALWITLEYLSAELWVREYHGLPSPHPRWAIPRYFFFPGFDPGTGGLLRERDLFTRRDSFLRAACREFWRSVGFDPPGDEVSAVSLFAYDDPQTTNLLAAWSESKAPILVAIPEGTSSTAVRAFFNVPSTGAGDRFERGGLEVRIVPFLPQSRYDELLWACDWNFVRGEDSFVRAQWGARPFVWQIYRQQADVHRPKLEAFMDRYCEGLPSRSADSLRKLWRAWNSSGTSPVGVNGLWESFRAEYAVLKSHAMIWAARLGRTRDLAEELAQFCSGKLKY